MDTLDVYLMMRQRLQQVKRQVNRIQPLIAADNLSADWLRGGIWNNAFEVWAGGLQLAWDLTDPAIDVTTIDYGLGSKVDLVALQAELTERNRTKLIALWRADMENSDLAVGPALGSLRASMVNARNWVAANYKTMTTADGISVDPVTGETVWQAIPKAQLAALDTLLSDTKTKLAPLVR